MRRELLTITVIALAGVVMLGGCKKKVAKPEAVAMSFTATTDGDGDEGGKTSLASNGAVLWSSGDQIKVNGTTMTLESGAGSYSGSFSGTASGSHYVAAYPAASATITSSTEGSESVTFTLPATQTLTENGFGNGANPMVAKSSSNYLAFRNVCGGIAVRLYGATAGTMDKIVVTGKNGKKLNGTYTVDYKGDTPSAELGSDGTGAITLTAASPVTLSTSSESPTVFYVMLPAGAYSGGFNVKAYGNDGTVALLDNDFTSVTTVERNWLYLLATTQVSGVPAVTTSAAASISATTATFNGNLTYAGIPTLTEKGFVYSSSNSTPTTSDTKVTVSGTAMGAYTYSATGLSLGTKYYVRAYATNSAGTVYGDVVSFSTSSTPDGCIAGVFSISDDSGTTVRQVYFSKGNLYYTNGAYAFQDDQWGYVDSKETSGTEYDKFAQGVAQGYTGASSSSISGYSQNWYNLTDNEWCYLLNIAQGDNGTSSVGTRTGTASGWHYSKVVVHDVNGLVILPDGMSTDNEVLLQNHDAPATDFSSITDDDWSTLEAAGCVFLPCAGGSDGYLGSIGNYWSTTSGIRYLYFSSGYVNSSNDYSYYVYSKSVRLVLEK